MIEIRIHCGILSSMNPERNMQTIENIEKLISDVSFKDWTIKVGQYECKTPYIQVLFYDSDRITGEKELQRCRKWILSYHMVDSEVVRTAFKAIEAAMLHEVQEEFKYKGVRIYNPHLDLDELVDSIKKKEVKISIRE